MKITVKVQNRHIEKGIGCDVTGCGIALVIRELFPDAFVGPQRMFFSTNDRKGITLPREAQDFISDFDVYHESGRNRPKPITFTIDVPSEVIDSIGIGQVYKILSESKTLELAEI
jgi:hypothetical protein